MAFKFNLRRGTAAQWTAANTLLGPGEPGYETDTKKLKIGDGVARWGSLPYFLPQTQLETFVANLVSSALEASNIPVIDNSTPGPTTVYSSGHVEELFASLIKNGITSNTSTWGSSKIREYVDGKIADIVGSAPDGFNTLEELANALSNPPAPTWTSVTSKPAVIAAGATQAAARDIIDVPSNALLNEGLSNKVSNSAHTADLATKADSSSVDSALATKVSTTQHSTDLATKVDKNTYDAAIASKVDSTTYNAGLLTKADLSAGKVPVSQLPGPEQFPSFVEAVQDVTGSLIKAGSNVSVTYDDANGTFTISASGGGTGTTDAEIVRDTIGGALVAGTGIQVLVNDAGDTITIAVSGLTTSMISGLDAALTAKAPLNSPTFTGTVSGITKAMVGLTDVDNTSDILKPISNAQATVNAQKAPLASPAFTGTPTGITKTHVGLGNVDNTADASKPVSAAQQAALDAKAPLASPAFTGTPTGITKTHVGLANVDNTSDANKPISSAQAAVNALKADLVSGAVPVSQIPTLSSSKISDFNEAAQDAVALLLQGASGVTLTYDDANNSLTITGGGAGGGLDAEAVRDAIGVALIGSGYISVVVNDAADTITITQSQALVDALAAKAADTSVVHLTGAENVAGTKTFLSIPLAPTTTPTLDAQVAVKLYVDTKIAKHSMLKNVVDFGADPTGVNKTATRTAYINAIAACAEGGTVYTPEGVFDWDGVIPLSASKLRLTFTGPGMVRGKFDAGDGSAKIESEYRFQNMRFYRPLDTATYPTKGYADDSYFIAVDRMRRIIIEDVEFYGAAAPIMVKANANAASHDISMLRIKNNFFNECDWAVNGKVATGVLYEAIADSQLIGNIVNKSYIGGFLFDGVDGVQIADNVFFMQNYNNQGGRAAEKLCNIWIKACAWTHIHNNNLFEAGTESIRIDAAKAYKITDNLIAWAGQRAMSNAIQVGSYSTVYSSGEWASGVIAGNVISFYTKSAIAVTGNHYELSIGLNSVRYNSTAASYKGTPALTTANHYRYDLSGLTGMKAQDIDIPGGVLARDGHYDLFPGHGYVRWLTRTDQFGLQSTSFRTLAFSATNVLPLFNMKDASDSSSTYSGRVTMIVKEGATQASASKTTTYELFLSKTADAVKVTQITAHGYEDGTAVDDPAFTWSINATNQLVASAVGLTAGTFNFTAISSGNIILG